MRRSPHVEPLVRLILFLEARSPETFQDQYEQEDVDRLLISLLQLSPQMETEVSGSHQAAL